MLRAAIRVSGFGFQGFGERPEGGFRKIGDPNFCTLNRRILVIRTPKLRYPLFTETPGVLSCRGGDSGAAHHDNLLAGFLSDVPAGRGSGGVSVVCLEPLSFP